MKVTLNWLKQYIEVPWTAEELADLYLRHDTYMV